MTAPGTQISNFTLTHTQRGSLRLPGRPSPECRPAGVGNFSEFNNGGSANPHSRAVPTGQHLMAMHDNLRSASDRRTFGARAHHLRSNPAPQEISVAGSFSDGWGGGA